MSTKLILAQGNPGNQYSSTRHNLGFLILDSFKDQLNFPDFQAKTKFHSAITELVQGDEKIILAKPTTFYNLTGQATRSLVDFYKITPENILVIHDDLSLNFGQIRIREKGSDGGNKGVKSINAHIGQDYFRLRVGIYNDLAEKIEASDFVLSKFTQDEVDGLKRTVIPASLEIIQSFLQGKLESTSHSLT